MSPKSFGWLGTVGVPPTSMLTLLGLLGLFVLQQLFEQLGLYPVAAWLAVVPLGTTRIGADRTLINIVAIPPKWRTTIDAVAVQGSVQVSAPYNTTITTFSTLPGTAIDNCQRCLL
jgi:hypothetical protein